MSAGNEVFPLQKKKQLRHMGTSFSNDPRDAIILLNLDTDADA